MKKHILIIDDEESIRLVLANVLTTKAYRVSQASDALQAMDQVKSDPPDLIISDLQLEESDGLKLVEEIRGLLPKVPILLLTGIAFDTEVVRKTISKKVSAYLQKTVSLQRILQEVRRLLGEPEPEPAPPRSKAT